MAALAVRQEVRAAGALAVAADARGGEVLGLIVEPVIVEMVNNEARTALLAPPCHFPAAPVAGMRAVANQVVEDLPMLVHAARLVGQRMTATGHDPIALVGHVIAAGASQAPLAEFIGDPAPHDGLSASRVCDKRANAGSLHG